MSTSVLLAELPPRSRPPRPRRIVRTSSEPWERILDLVPESQRRLYMVDDAAAARVLRAYATARDRVATDLTRAWERTDAGSKGSPLQRLELLRSAGVLTSLTLREAEIRGETATTVRVGFNTARLEGHVQSTAERAAMAAAFPVLRASLAHPLSQPSGRRPRSTFTTVSPFVSPPSVAEEVLVDRAVQDMTVLAEEVRNTASEELIASTLRGDGVPEIVRRLTPVFDGNSRRATIVARHVVIRAYNESREIGYKSVQDELAKFGRQVLKMWICELDERACPVCLALHGVLTDLDGNFPLDLTFGAITPVAPWPDPNRLAGPPRHPRCRCTHAPWVTGWQAGTIYTPEYMQRQARRWAHEAGILGADEVVPAIRPMVPSPPSGVGLSEDDVELANLNPFLRNHFESKHPRDEKGRFRPKPKAPKPPPLPRPAAPRRPPTDPVSDPERVHSASIRSLPRQAYSSAVTAYLTCATGQGALPPRRNA